VVVGETDLWVCAESDLTKQVRDLVFMFRHQIETYIERHPEFLTSLIPLDEDPYAPPIVKDMIRCAKNAGVGPMASVAGAVAEWVGKALL
jgi:ApbE superfamily uncharacterized protein (UPF0280 family)